MLILENPKYDAHILQLTGVNCYQHQLFFDTKKENTEKNDQLIEAVEQRMKQRIETECLFTIRWSVV